MLWLHRFPYDNIFKCFQKLLSFNLWEALLEVLINDSDKLKQHWHLLSLGSFDLKETLCLVNPKLLLLLLVQTDFFLHFGNVEVHEVIDGNQLKDREINSSNL